MTIADTVLLWRPIGPKELKLIETSDMKAFPPSLLKQPIFYPVLSEAYATKITRQWNVPAYGVGYVTKFSVRRDYIDRYQVHEAGGRKHLEYWIPSKDMDVFNAAIIGKIEIVGTYKSN